MNRLNRCEDGAGSTGSIRVVRSVRIVGTVGSTASAIRVALAATTNSAGETLREPRSAGVVRVSLTLTAASSLARRAHRPASCPAGSRGLD